jgi:DNA phosphorothioation-dependent restriction protein DptG
LNDRLLQLTALAGSGKSHFCQALLEESTRRGITWVRISQDQLGALYVLLMYLLLSNEGPVHAASG